MHIVDRTVKNHRKISVFLFFYVSQSFLKMGISCQNTKIIFKFWQPITSFENILGNIQMFSRNFSVFFPNAWVHCCWTGSDNTTNHFLVWEEDISLHLEKSWENLGKIQHFPVIFPWFFTVCEGEVPISIAH